MFGKKEAPARVTVPSGRIPAPVPKDSDPLPNSTQPPAPAPMKPATTNEGSTPSIPKSSLISDGSESIGDMKSAGALTVDGTIKGNLIVQSLLVRATGVVDGSVKAESVNVEGCLSGAIACRDLVIGGRAVVEGNLSYSTVTIQKGGTIKGEVKRA